MAQNSSPSMLQLYAAPALRQAVKAAAEREMTTMSEYVRRTLIDRLRASGFDPTASKPINQVSAVQQPGTVHASVAA
jgi:hypothetical protein